jgi:hypothetical protein
MVTSAAKLGTKNNQAGEDQQQFTRLADQPQKIKFLYSVPSLQRLIISIFIIGLCILLRVILNYK